MGILSGNVFSERLHIVNLGSHQTSEYSYTSVLSLVKMVQVCLPVENSEKQKNLSFTYFN